MKTVVLTRLAIDPFADRDLTTRGDHRDLRFLDEDWLSARLTLFRNCALASMLSQAVEPDCWLVAVDSRNLEKVDTVIEELPPWAHLLVLSPSQLFTESVRAAMADLGDDILTIRLDSDDLVRSDFIRLARQKSRPNCGINFSHGAQLIVETGALFHRWLSSGPNVGFRALQTDLNVHDFGNHPNVGRTVRMRRITTLSPMFIKVAHANNNVWFQPNGIPVIRRNALACRFEVDLLEKEFGLSKQFQLFISHLGYRLNKLSPSLARKLARHKNSRQFIPSNPM